MIVPNALLTVRAPPLVRSQPAGVLPSFTDTHSSWFLPLNRIMASEGASEGVSPGVTMGGTGLYISVSLWSSAESACALAEQIPANRPTERKSNRLNGGQATWIIIVVLN